MKIPDEIIEQVRSQSDIIDVIGQHISLHRSGSNYKGLCPFHDEKTPSFVVSPDRQIYKCFGCGAGGNVFSFIMDYHSITFPEAVEILARQLGIVIKKDAAYQGRENKKAQAIKALAAAAEIYYKNLKTAEGKKAAKYFKKRGYTDETIKDYLLGYSIDSWDDTLNQLRKQGFTYESLLDAGLIRQKSGGGYFDYFRGRAMFAIKDFLGRVIGFGARVMADDVKTAKYINSPQSIVYDKSTALYGIFEAKNEIRDKKEAIVVEGYADVLSLHQAGIKNVIASSGTALTDGQLKVLSRLADKLFLIYDGDDAGKNAVNRALPAALKAGFEVFIALMPEGEDPDSIIKNQGKEKFSEYIAHAVDFVKFKLNYKRDSLKSIKGKTQLAREIIELIALIPDRLQHDFYINEIIHPIGLSEKQVNEIYKDKDKLYHSSRVDSVRPKHSTDKLISKLLAEEEVILRIALLGPNELDMMLERHEISIETFRTQIGRRIFEIILDHSDVDNFLEAIMDNEDINDTGKAVISALAIEKETVSKNFEKIGIEISEPELDKAVYDCKLRLELLEIKDKIDDIRNKLSNPTPDIDEIKLLTEKNELSSKKDKIIIELGQKGL